MGKRTTFLYILILVAILISPCKFEDGTAVRITLMHKKQKRSVSCISFLGFVKREHF